MLNLNLSEQRRAAKREKGLLNSTSILGQMQWITSKKNGYASGFVPLTFASSAIANQESLSALETEMRKLEGIVKEVVEEMTYLKKREERFQETNGAATILCIVDTT